MKTFQGWRAAGRAMRWARQQPDVTVTRKPVGNLTRNEWRYGEQKVAILHSAAYGEGVNCRGGSTAVTFDLYTTDAAALIDALIGLGLLPLEREACPTSLKCTHCGGVARIGPAPIVVALDYDDVPPNAGSAS